MRSIFVGLLFLLCFCVRWAVLESSSDTFQADPDAYRTLAIELKSTGLFGTNSQPTAFRPPLYPWALSFAVDDNHTLSSAHLKVLHALLGALTCLMAYRLANYAQNLIKTSKTEDSLDQSKESGNRKQSPSFKQAIAPSIAAVLVAIDPILLRQSQLIMTETLATFLAAMTLWSMCLACRTPTPRSFGFAGLTIGLSALCRPTAIVWGGLFVFAMIATLPFIKSPNSKSPNSTTPRGMIKNAIGFGLGVCVFVLPWSLRNYRELDRWIVTTTHGGYTLLLANNDSLYDHFDRTMNRDWDDSSFQADWVNRSQGMSELEQDQLANSIAKDTIQRRPIDFVKSCFIRFCWLWAPWPNQSHWIVSSAIGVWYTLLYLAAMIGFMHLWRSRSILQEENSNSAKTILLPVGSLVLSLSLVHCVYWSNLRMRSVAIPALCVVATIPISARLVAEEKNTSSAD